MTTEWEDIQIKFGNMAPKVIHRAPTTKEYDEDALEEKEAIEDEQRQQFVDAATEQPDLLDDLDDDVFMEELRKKRMEELKAKAVRDRFGGITFISETDYKREVTDAGDIWVVVFLYKAGIPHCQLMEQKLRILADKFKSTKFVQIKSEDAIRGYPDRNLPTLLVYNQGDVKMQFIGLAPFGGESMTEKDLQWSLQQVGAIESELEENPRQREEGRINITKLASRYSNWSDEEED